MPVLPRAVSLLIFFVGSCALVKATQAGDYRIGFAPTKAEPGGRGEVSRWKSPVRLKNPAAD